MQKKFTRYNLQGTRREMNECRNENEGEKLREGGEAEMQERGKREVVRWS